MGGRSRSGWGCPGTGHWGPLLSARAVRGRGQGICGVGLDNRGLFSVTRFHFSLCPTRLPWVCLHLNVSLSLSLSLWVSPHLPPRLCLGAWHTLAAVLPPPVSCPPGMLPPLVYRGWKNPLASRRPKRPWGGEEAGTGVGMLREGQPWGAGPGGRRRGCVPMGVSSCGPGQARNTSSSHMPWAIPAPGHSSGGPPPSLPLPLPVATGHTWGSANLSHHVYFPFLLPSPALTPNVSGNCQGLARARCGRGRLSLYPISVLS